MFVCPHYTGLDTSSGTGPLENDVGPLNFQTSYNLVAQSGHYNFKVMM